MANITLQLLCEWRPRDDEPCDTAIIAGQNDTIEISRCLAADLTFRTDRADFEVLI